MTLQSPTNHQNPSMNSGSVSRKKTYFDEEFIFLFVVVLSFYSFGTFGFFNLFGLRTMLAFTVFFYSFLGLIVLSRKKMSKKSKLSLVIFVVFFGYYGVMNVLRIRNIVVLAEPWIAFVIFSYLWIARERYIRKISKSIVIFSFLFSIMGLFTFVYYLVYPETNLQADTSIFSSTTGQKQITPRHFTEYLSFTSGSGFSFLGHQITRPKGFSNEPSATIVHYCAPIALSCMLGGVYTVMGLVILLFNICISSLVGIIVIVGTMFVFLLFSTKNRYFTMVVALTSSLIMLVLLYKIDRLLQLNSELGNTIFQATSYDLIAKKSGKAGSLYQRSLSFKKSWDEIMSHPFGGSSYNTPTGLLSQLGLVGGFVLISIYVGSILRIVQASMIKFKVTNQIKDKIGISCAMSTLFVATFISGYGWDRIPGVVMLMLFFRHISSRHPYKQLRRRIV